MCVYLQYVPSSSVTMECGRRLLCLWNSFRQEWSGFAIPSLRVFSAGIKPRSLVYPALVGSLYHCTTWEVHLICNSRNAFNASSFTGSIVFTKGWKIKTIKYRGGSPGHPLEKAKTRKESLIKHLICAQHHPTFKCILNLLSHFLIWLSSLVTFVFLDEKLSPGRFKQCLRSQQIKWYVCVIQPRLSHSVVVSS